MSKDKITRKPKKVQAVPEFCMINKLHVHCVDDVLLHSFKLTFNLKI